MIVCSAVAKVGSQWWIGFLDGKKFHKKQKVQKLKDVKSVSEYITLKKFLKERKLDDDPKELLKRFKVSSMYILEKPFELNVKEWEQWWWSEFNEKCKGCKKDCKQSHRAEIGVCKSYEKM